MAFVFFLVTAFGCAKIEHKPRLFLGSSEAKWVGEVLSQMAIEEKIGQLMICPYSGRFLNRESEEMISLESLVVKRKIGGLILYKGNVYETARLTNRLQKLAKIPLLISSDLERGLGNQIEGATQFPPLMALGAIGSEEKAYLLGKVTAAEARAIGIHLTYAPVADVNINPDNPIINVRSLGESPEHVSRLANAFIKGCQDNALLATAKHFPGHGDTDLDSHSELPTINAGLERLEKVELYPFRKAIETGVSVIMSSHLHLPVLDPTSHLPASLSSTILTELLRKKLGFKGLIVTDAMDMGGITNLYSPQEAALKAIQAGADLILKSPHPEEVINFLLEAVKRGELSEGRVDASVKRILMVKAKLGIHKKRLVNTETLDKAIASDEHIQLSQQMFEESITLVKNDNQVLPLADSKLKIAVYSLSSDPGGYFAGRTFIEEIEEKYPALISFYADAYTGENFLQEALEKIDEVDVVVFALFSRRQARKGTVDLVLEHIEMVREAAEGLTPVVVISFGSPYFIRHFPQVDSYFCVYRWSKEAQKTAVRAIFGEIDIKGKLPVSIPALYPLGHGLFLPKKSE